MSHGIAYRDGDRPRWIYFARIDIGQFDPCDGRARTISLIKIGTSLWPTTRVSDMRRTYNASAELLACMPGGFDDEKAIHERFQNSRLMPVYNNIPGELFYPTRDLLAFIDEIRKESDDTP